MSAESRPAPCRRPWHRRADRADRPDRLRAPALRAAAEPGTIGGDVSMTAAAESASCSKSSGWHPRRRAGHPGRMLDAEAVAPSRMADLTRRLCEKAHLE